jgi:anti-anti-sigma regulatory factor
VTINQPNGGTVILKIEGRVFGPNANELDRAWHDLASSLGTRKLSVDLRDVTFVDAIGKRLLAQIHAETGAEFLADTPLTKYFAEQAQQGNGTRLNFGN